MLEEVRYDALAIGPGLTTDDGDGEARPLVLERCPKPLLIDADGINALEGRFADVVRASKVKEIVITPHSGELKRLAGESAPELPVPRIEWLRELVRDTGVTVVHKGAPTVVVNPDGSAGVNVARPSGAGDRGERGRSERRDRGIPRAGVRRRARGAARRLSPRARRRDRRVRDRRAGDDRGGLHAGASRSPSRSWSEPRSSPNHERARSHRSPPRGVSRLRHRGRRGGASRPARGDSSSRRTPPSRACISTGASRTLSQAVQKLVTSNVSDIFAMGGSPGSIVFTAGLPAGCASADVDAIIDGLKRSCAQYGMKLVGRRHGLEPRRILSSTSRSSERCGPAARFCGRARARGRDRSLRRDRALARGIWALLETAILERLRAIARPRELERLAGALGGSPAADAARCVQRHLVPLAIPLEASLLDAEPPCVTAMIDVSDGLAKDLRTLCAESGVGAADPGGCASDSPGDRGAFRARGGGARRFRPLERRGVRAARGGVSRGGGAGAGPCGAAGARR